MKIVGCVIVTVFSTLVGYVYADNEAKKLCILEELYVFVGKILSGIKIRTPLDEICFLYTSSENTMYIKGVTYAQITDSLKKLKSDGVCKKEAEMCIDLITTASKTADASEIEKQCTLVSDYVSERLTKFRTEYAKKKGLYVKLGAAFGLLLCICML